MEDKKNIEKVLLGIAGGEDITFKIVNDNPTFLEKVFRKKYFTFTVRRFTTLDQNIRINKLLLSIPEFNLEDKSDSEAFVLSVNFTAKYTEIMIDIISILLRTNKKSILRRNLMNKDIFEIYVQMLAMIDYQSFMTSTALIRSKVGLKG